MPNQGNLASFSAKQPGSAGPPFPVGSADNGLSVNTITGVIELGQTFAAVGNPAILLHNTEIPMGGFTFRWNNNGFNKLQLNNGAGIYQLGDAQAEVNGTHLGILDATKEIHLASGGNNYLQLDVLNNRYRFGDIDVFNNGMTLDINDGFGSVDLGDINGMFNGAMIEILTSGVNLGDTNGITTGANLDINLAQRRLNFQDGLGNQFLDINPFNNIYRMGDMSAANNGNFFTVDDATSLFKIKNTALNAVVEMNGIAGFTGTVAPVNTITVDGGIVTNVA